MRINPINHNYNRSVLRQQENTPSNETPVAFKGYKEKMLAGAFVSTGIVGFLLDVTEAFPLVLSGIFGSICGIMAQDIEELFKDDDNSSNNPPSSGFSCMA